MLSAEGDEPALVFVTGASGSGKSSFVQAGVVPALEGAYGTRLRWAVARPGRHPMLAINRALDGLDQARCGEQPSGRGRVSEAAHERSGHRIRARRLAAGKNRSGCWCWTSSRNCSPRRRLMSGRRRSPGCADCDRSRTSRLQVIATLRSDYLPAIFNEPVSARCVQTIRGRAAGDDGAGAGDGDYASRSWSRRGSMARRKRCSRRWSSDWWRMSVRTPRCCRCSR